MGRWTVCAAWPYVNDRPHLGTFIHPLSADVFARYLRMKGEDVILVSGSDEHGTAIEVEALRRGVSPYELASRNHEIIKHLIETMRLDFSNYTRTESKLHISFVQDFYRKVDSNGYVYSLTLKLPYCETDTRFMPDRFVEGECPYCHFPQARGDQCDNCSRVLDPTDLINPYCVICHRTPIVKESRHWFFDLPRLADRLKRYVKANENFPENARNFSLSWLAEGLKPRSLTRDNQWGIPAPFKGAEGKTLYVWMEAVLGYVSATKEWAEKSADPEIWKKFWFDPNSRNVHFIGKDNIPFHTIVFPGLLEATGEKYSLPWQVSSTEFFLFDDQRFSKSRGIGVWMDEALQLEGPEYWRYAMLSLRPELKDTNFTWEEFERKINTELNDVVGNFVHRTLSFIQSNFGGVVPSFDPEKSKSAIENITAYAGRVSDKLEHFRLKEALETLVDFAREANRYLNEKEPWRKMKTDRDDASQTMGIAVQYVLAIAIMLHPFLPESSALIRRILGKKNVPEWREVGRSSVKPGTKIGAVQPLFHKVSARELRERLDKLRRTKPSETQN